MKINRSHCSVVGGWEVFGEIVCEVVLSFFPVDVELSLANSVSYPVESHINGLGSFLLDCVIDDAFCTGVVCLDRGRWLGVAEKFEGVA